jgi:hypothetical protein
VSVLTRRQLLQLGAAAAAGVAVPGVARAAASPYAALDAWQAELDALGLRAPASPVHERYIDTLHERLVRAGVQNVREQRVPIRRWTAGRWALALDDGPVATAAYIPSSGSTTEAGVSGPLVLLPDGDIPPGALDGAIVLFHVSAQELPSRALRAIATRVHDPAGRLDSGTYVRWQPGQARVSLDRLAGTGAVGAIGILDLPADLAAGGYFPYDGVIRATPGVYVDRDTGARLEAAARAGARATVTLTAQVADTSSRNLIGELPGRSREVVLLNSHTDGPNGIEENGANAVVAIAAALARRPLARTVVVSLTTAHFSGSAGQRAFLAAERDGLVPRIAAALTVEHLGARHVGLDGAVSPLPEPALFFAPESRALMDAAYAAATHAGTDPTLVCRPITTGVAGSPDGRSFPAEGGPLWAQGAIPTANFITDPIYLFNWGRSTMPYFDGALMRRQARAFEALVVALGRVPRARLRALDL